MIFHPSNLQGVVVIESVPDMDQRGHFARFFSAEEFVAHGLDARVEQSSVSYNQHAYTLRGMHFQKAPFAEAKLVRCSRGSAFDVAIDLRPGSPTYCSWFGVELSDVNHLMLFVPEGCAHGFLTLEDGTEVAYQISQRYSPQHAQGVRWDDPCFGIDWPRPPIVISQRDSEFPDYEP